MQLRTLLNKRNTTVTSTIVSLTFTAFTWLLSTAMDSYRSEVLTKTRTLNSLLKLIPTGKDMKAPSGKYHGLILSMKMSLLPAGTTGKSVSGSNNR
jgi:hypothetical protein